MEDIKREQVYTVVVFDEAGAEAARWHKRSYTPEGAVTLAAAWQASPADPARITPAAPVPVAGPWLVRQIIDVTAAALASEDPAERRDALAEIERLLGQRPVVARALAEFRAHDDAQEGMREALRTAGLYPGGGLVDNVSRMTDALEAWRAGPDTEDNMRDALAAAQARAWRTDGRT